MNMLDNEVNEEGIASMSKNIFKKIVKTKVKDAVLKVMKEEQKLHTKTRNINYTDLKLQTYMSDKNSNNSMMETLVAWRSSMVRGIAQNFASSSQATVCPLGCRASDTQQHLLQCPPLLAELTIAEDKIRDFSQYEDIFGEVEGQLRLAPVLRRLLETREDLLQLRDLPVGTYTGPSTT